MFIMYQVLSFILSSTSIHCIFVDYINITTTLSFTHHYLLMCINWPVHFKFLQLLFHQRQQKLWNLSSLLTRDWKLSGSSSSSPRAPIKFIIVINIIIINQNCALSCLSFQTYPRETIRTQMWLFSSTFQSFPVAFICLVCKLFKWYKVECKSLEFLADCLPVSCKCKIVICSRNINRFPKVGL